MICKVKATILRHAMLENVRSVAVGVSGGADSMCLLHILNSFKEEYGIILKAVHINHGIRGDEALRDENVVREFCEKLGTELLVFHKDIPYLAKQAGLGEEECGRKIRYECFRQAGCDAVATAHSLSDSIETVMFNLLRGTGTKGLCGIPPVRQGNIIRPLIECSREEIEKYCTDNGISYVTDSTNLSDDYSRNFIRHNIVSEFGSVNENYRSNIADALSILRTENSFIEQCAQELISKAKCDEGYRCDIFRSAHKAVMLRAITMLLKQNMTKSTEKKHVELAWQIISEGEGKIELSKDLFICCKSDIISFRSGSQQAVVQWECCEKDGRFHTPYGTFALTECSTADLYCKDAINGDMLNGTLEMTSRRQGDSFSSAKRKVTKSLKKLFNEDKIPEEKRGELAVLRHNGELVWLEGYGCDAKYSPEKNTEKVFIIKKEG